MAASTPTCHKLVPVEAEPRWVTASKTWLRCQPVAGQMGQGRGEVWHSSDNALAEPGAALGRVWSSQLFRCPLRTQPLGAAPQEGPPRHEAAQGALASCLLTTFPTAEQQVFPGPAGLGEISGSASSNLRLLQVKCRHVWLSGGFHCAAPT